MEDSKEFEAWFIRKFGPRQMGGPNELPGRTDTELNRIAEAGDTAKRVLAYRRIWDEKYQAALLVWSERK